MPQKCQKCIKMIVFHSILLLFSGVSRSAPRFPAKNLIVFRALPLGGAPVWEGESSGSVGAVLVWSACLSLSLSLSPSPSPLPLPLPLPLPSALGSAVTPHQGQTLARRARRNRQGRSAHQAQPRGWVRLPKPLPPPLYRSARGIGRGELASCGRPIAPSLPLSLSPLPSPLPLPFPLGSASLCS